MLNAQKATLNGVIDVISHQPNAEKAQNHGMSVVYHCLEANKDIQHRSKFGSWKQRVTPKLDLIPVQYSISEPF